MKSTFFPKAVLGAALLAVAAAASADSFSFDGSFAKDNDLVYFKFTADGTSEVILRSYGYAGGTQGNGNSVAPGGFDTLFTLYDRNGLMVDPGGNGFLNDDGDGVPADPVTGNAYDSRYSGVLAAGDYWLVLSEANNLGNNTLHGHFGWDFWGDSNRTSATFACAPVTNTPFHENDCYVRNGQWALDLDNVTGAEIVPRPTIPEPGSLALMALGLAALARGKKPAA